MTTPKPTVPAEHITDDVLDALLATADEAEGAPDPEEYIEGACKAVRSLALALRTERDAAKPVLDAVELFVAARRATLDKPDAEQVAALLQAGELVEQKHGALVAQSRRAK